ncbi:MAG: hypothetical protein EOM10_17055 [Opitutae bacterium]|nr:hypothetical protein [Opitutae bacterium]
MHHVTLWQRGRLTRQLRLFRLLQRAEPGPTRRDREEALLGLPAVARSYDAATGGALRALFNAVGLDITTGAGEIRPDNARAGYDALVGTAHAAALTLARLASFERAPTRPVAWLSRVLGRLGLRLGHVRAEGPRNARRWVYAIDREACFTASGACWA